MCVYLYYCLIKKIFLINKVIKQNRVHDSYCEIKYLDLYIFLNSFSLLV